MDYSKKIEQVTSFVDVRKFMYMSFLRDELMSSDLADVYAGRFANGGDEVVLLGVFVDPREESDPYVTLRMHVVGTYDNDGNYEMFGIENARQEWSYVTNLENE